MTIVITNFEKKFMDDLNFLMTISMNIKEFQKVKISNLVDNTNVSDDLAATIFV